MEAKRQKRIDFINVINPKGPKGTNWCSFATAKLISEWIIPESQEKLANMLSQRPEDLLLQMKKGYTRLAIWKGRLVGHITLWKYNTTGWGEIGSLIVDPSFRDQGAGTILVRAISAAFPNPLHLTATIKTERAEHVFKVNGFEVISFDDLRAMSESAWRECCPCYFPPEVCPKRDGVCKLLIRRR